MPYSEKATKIRSNLSRYSKLHFFNEILAYLHAPEDGPYATASKMPWLSFLLIEWLFQVDEVSSPRVPSRDNVIAVLNEMYALQSDAVCFEDALSLDLALRKMMISQLWVQKNQIYHLFSLIRLYALLTGRDTSETFALDFESANGISIDDFFSLCLWLMIAMDRSNGFIQYKDIVLKLTPGFDVDVIVRFLSVVGIRLDSMEGFLLSSKISSVEKESYFDSSVLFEKPLIFMADRVVTPHKNLLSKSISNYVLNSLKSLDHQRFKNKFTKRFEWYVGNLIEEFGVDFVREDDIKEVYRKHGVGGKVVDFLISEDGASVFVDAKGVEPSRNIHVSDNPRVIRDRLKTSFIKGIKQSFECSNILSKLDDQDTTLNTDKYVLVVSHHDFYILNGRKLHENVDPNFFPNLNLTYGEAIQKENVYFICVEDFEGILNLCSNINKSLSSFLCFCVEQDSKSETRKFDVRQHIAEYSKINGHSESTPIGSNYILDRKNEIFETIASKLKNNESYWRRLGANGVEEYWGKYKAIIGGLGGDLE
ncbi:hypothetical protein NO559_12370 [Dasania sp. GY-MA-18]|uniref:Uncharacterized protein n=1 Tax=Dasania phycosphaerae TaxID=2950436 RepID=A0A9J6RNC9_9GAMM|nr:MULTISPECIES: hypothetical protein [Dasania]MCR8923570.1 hypothetical protein [Dasania sp. GY-MA-18]MCZ0866004.1 hypothetical protein [Dasania phycosphaerae]MCZ0869728.1 hypothetical protein [Dasania phycosphaerae]